MENNNDVFKKESSWNPLTKKQENTFGFTDRKEISDFAQKIIQKHAPEELKNYDLKIKFNDVKAQTWANIKHINKQLDVHEWNLKRGYDKNVIKLNISKNLLHPAIPLILKKNVLIHELTHLFSQRSHVFYNLKTRKWELREKEKLKKGFDSDEKIEKLTQGHTKEFAEQYHFLLKKVMGIDVKKFPAFKYIAGKNKKEYKNISLKKDFINVWHRNNFIRLGAKKGWLGMSEKDFNDYIEKKLEMHKELRKDISELKIDLKENREDEIINNMIFRNNVLIKRLKVHQEQSSDFTWDRQIAIDKLEESNKKWNKIWEQKKKKEKY